MGWNGWMFCWIWTSMWPTNISHFSDESFWPGLCDGSDSYLLTRLFGLTYSWWKKSVYIIMWDINTVNSWETMYCLLSESVHFSLKNREFLFFSFSNLNENLPGSVLSWLGQSVFEPLNPWFFGLISWGGRIDPLLICSDSCRILWLNGQPVGGPYWPMLHQPKSWA